ncbi:MAG: FAD-binding protein [Geminicoccaceae bacterium]
MRWKAETLSGWGNSFRASSLVCRPERQRELGSALAGSAWHSLIAYGGGRSYGDNALNDQGRAIRMERLDRLLSFDERSGVLVAEGGVPLRAIVTALLPRGFILPVSPGTAFATVGGALANDVHGKNHESAGSFGDHVLWLDLLTADGNLRRVNPGDESGLFRATVGGCGLTGVIVQAAIKLQRVPSSYVQVKERRVANLDAFLEGFEACRNASTFSVGWIDGIARGASLGRGILETAEFVTGAERALPAVHDKRVPVNFPGFALNKLSIRAFNEAYFRRIPASGRNCTVAFPKFLYPLDALLEWNKIYGKRGFFQFQCVLPDEQSTKGLQRLMETISAAGLASFLAVLKTLGGEGRGFLSFPMRGYTLALDFPKSSAAEELLGKLERITLDNGGRIYLAKDSQLSVSGFRQMYPKLADMQRILGEIDPRGQFNSDQARRLGIRRESV